MSFMEVLQRMYRRLFYSKKSYYLLNYATLEIRDPEIQKVVNKSRAGR